MNGIAVLFARSAGGIPLQVVPELASWDKAGSPGQIRLAAFLAHVDCIAGPAIAKVDGPVAVELIVGARQRSRAGAPGARRPWTPGPGSAPSGSRAGSEQAGQR